MAKYMITFAKEFDRMLKKLAEDKETTKADMVRCALIYYAGLDQKPIVGTAKR